MGVDVGKKKKRKVNLTSTWACERLRCCVKMAVAWRQRARSGRETDQVLRNINKHKILSTRSGEEGRSHKACF